MEETKILDHYAVHTEGDYATIVDTRTNLVVDKFNIKKEMFKQNLKRTGLSVLLGAFLATSAIAGIKHKKADLETRTNNSITLDHNPSSHNLTLYPQEKEDMDKITKNVNQVYSKISTRSFELPSYINPQFVRATFSVESSDNPNIPSPKGAEGYPQTYYSTWKDVFPKDSIKDFNKGIKNIEKSTEFVIKYYINLDNLAKKNCPGYNSLSPDSKRNILAASYNIGSKKLENNGWRTTNLPETRNHVKKMQIAYAKFI